jgi:hypothetical protein
MLTDGRNNKSIDKFINVNRTTHILTLICLGRCFSILFFDYITMYLFLSLFPSSYLSLTVFRIRDSIEGSLVLRGIHEDGQYGRNTSRYEIIGTSVNHEFVPCWFYHVILIIKANEMHYFSNLVHLVGFIIRIYHDARSSECHIYHVRLDCTVQIQYKIRTAVLKERQIFRF